MDQIDFMNRFSIAPLVIINNNMYDGDMKVCLNPMNDKGSDNKEGDTKNGSHFQNKVFGRAACVRRK